VVLVCLGCAWLAGIFLGSVYSLPLSFILTALIPLSMLIFLRSHAKVIILITLSLLTLLGGIAWYQTSLPVTDENHLHFYNDRGTVSIKGIASADPELKENSIQLQLEAREIYQDQAWHEVSGTALIFIPRYSDYRYGDVLRITGEMETPGQLDGFDYAGYLAHQGIYTTMQFPEVETLARGEGSKILGWIYSVRKDMSQTLARVLPEPQAGVAQGIVLGIRGNIPEPLASDFSNSGTAHLLAISGLHLSIMAGILVSIGIWLLGRRHYLYIWFAMSIIWLYVFITGMHAPVIRGAIMASLFLTAELLGRQRNTITALVFAAAVMVGIDPQILWTVSFQMSFLAMTGLIFIFPHLRDAGRNLVTALAGENEKGAAVAGIARIATDSFTVSLGAIIAVWPLTASYFGTVSLVGPLATFLALPVLPGIIVIGASAGVLGFLALPAAQFTGWLAWPLLAYLVVIVEGFARLPFSAIETSNTSVLVIIAYYVLLALALLFFRYRHRLVTLLPRVTAKLRTAKLHSRSAPKWVIPPLLLLAILASATAASMPDSKLHVSFLDVGQGDAILVQTPAHQDILIDGGPSPKAIALELSRQMPFWDRTIDLVVLTHAHSDHVTGLIEVLERYEVKQILVPGMDSDSPVYNEWLNTIRDKNIATLEARAGQEIYLGEETTLRVIAPASILLTGTGSDIDDNGTVMELAMGEVSFLLTADIRQEAEYELLNRRAIRHATVLKAAHHGSDTSTSDEFLAVASPQLTVISVGAGNRFSHPGDEVIGRLREYQGEDNILCTSEHGTIEFTTDGNRLWVSTAR